MAWSGSRTSGRPSTLSGGTSDVLTVSGLGTYSPENNVRGTAWARERVERREHRLAEHAAFMAQRREQADEARPRCGWRPYRAG